MKPSNPLVDRDIQVMEIDEVKKANFYLMATFFFITLAYVIIKIREGVL